MLSELKKIQFMSSLIVNYNRRGNVTLAPTYTHAPQNMGSLSNAVIFLNQRRDLQEFPHLIVQFLEEAQHPQRDIVQFQFVEHEYEASNLRSPELNFVIHNIIAAQMQSQGVLPPRNWSLFVDMAMYSQAVHPSATELQNRNFLSHTLKPMHVWFHDNSLSPDTAVIPIQRRGVEYTETLTLFVLAFPNVTNPFVYSPGGNSIRDSSQIYKLRTAFVFKIVLTGIQLPAERVSTPTSSSLSRNSSRSQSNNRGSRSRSRSRTRNISRSRSRDRSVSRSRPSTKSSDTRSHSYSRSRPRRHNSS